MYCMKSYNIWIDILDEFINQGFLQPFHFDVVTLLHSIKLNLLTHPQILKSRHVYIEVYMFLILILVEVTNKQWMVIMDKMDLLNLFVLGMEKSEDDKMMNPHCFFTLLSTVAIHRILMWRGNTTISKLFTYWTLDVHVPSIFLQGQPIWLLVLLPKKNQAISSRWFMQKWISFFLIFLKYITFWLVSILDFVVCG